MKSLRLAFILVVACRSPEPQFVDEPAVKPLPPASGTPIGILLDEGSVFDLRTDQRAKLEDIDRKLATRNEQLAGQLRSSEHPSSAPGGGPPGGPGGGMGGGMRGGMGGPPGGMGGPPGGGMGGGGRRGGRNGGQPTARKPPPGAGKLDAEMAANVRAAIEEALASLDPDQRPRAQALLEDRGALPSRQQPPGGARELPPDSEVPREP